MATFKVQLIDGSHRVMGLQDMGDPDTLLILRYPEGDCDTRMRTKEKMHNALYDLFQCNDDLKQGDIFETEFGRFKCEGVHVVPA